MKTRKTTPSSLRQLLGGSVLALAIVATSGALIVPAFADEWRHGRADARDHEWREHDGRRDDDHGYRWYAPGYAYNYGPVAPGYVPAPAYGAPVPFFNFGVEFR